MERHHFQAVVVKAFAIAITCDKEARLASDFDVPCGSWPGQNAGAGRTRRTPFFNLRPSGSREHVSCSGLFLLQERTRTTASALAPHGRAMHATLPASPL